ncbi:hypothetical protein [Paenibacillus sp. FSL P4-0288]|uniref:hypothetical protein n=1 Tax=Paenibacillus sp. FSL P4-0288 TaxID=2921633 RepID=UPI0030F62715
MRLKRTLDGKEELIALSLHKRLWLFVLDHCKKNDINASFLFEVLVKEYLKSPFPSSYNPDRRVLPKNKSSIFNKEFPIVNTSLLIHRDLTVKLVSHMKEASQLLYPNVEHVNVSCATNILFYSYSIKLGYPSNDPFFSDEYFNEKYSVTKESISKNLYDLQLIMGRPVTAREYSQLRNDERILGPSLSVIIEIFGSFNNAKKL